MPREGRGVDAKRILQGTLSLAIVVAIFAFAFPQLADYGDVWDEIKAMTSLEILTLLLVAVWNLVTYWFVLVAVMPGLTYPKAAISNQASTAVANRGAASVRAGGLLENGRVLSYVRRQW